jgi:uncharacterized protein YdaU (DUF1376 family)
MLMTPAQEGAYIRLLSIAWGSEDCGLPDDDTQLAVLSRLGEEWFNGGSTVVRKCFKQKNGRLYNERLLEERKKQDVWREKSRQGGIKSGRIRNNSDLAHEGWLKGGCDLVEPKGNSSSSFSSSSSPSINTTTNTKERSRDMGVKRFTPPTLEEVKAYCLERGKGVDPERWMDHYLSNGWKVGKALAPMKDWKAGVRTWEGGNNGTRSQGRPVADTRKREGEDDPYDRIGVTIGIDG